MDKIILLLIDVCNAQLLSCMRWTRCISSKLVWWWYKIWAHCLSSGRVMMYKDVVKQSRAHALACRMIFHHHHQWRAHMTSYAHIRDLKGCNILPPCHMVCVYVFVGVEKNMCTIKRTTVRGEKCWGVQKRGSFVGHAWIRHWCVVNIVWPYDTHTKGSSDLFTFRHPSLPLCMVKDIESYSFF